MPLRKSIILGITLIISAHTYSYAQETEYGQFNAPNQQKYSVNEEAEYWNNEANILISQIETVLAKYQSLKKEETTEMEDYKRQVLALIEGEKQKKLIVEQQCNQSGVKCELVEIHNSNLNKLNERLRILNSYNNE